MLCPRCHGFGTWEFWGKAEVCTYCEGRGEVDDEVVTGWKPVVYPHEGERIKAVVHWGRSKLNGEHVGEVVGRPFRARSGAVLRKMKCETCGREHCIPWTSDRRIIEFYVEEVA